MEITLYDFLAHPLVVVIAGGIVAAVVGSNLTRQWEAKKAGFDLKLQLLKEVSAQTARILSYFRSDFRLWSIEPEKAKRLGETWNEFEEFYIDFLTRLEILYPQSDLQKYWYNAITYLHALLQIYVQPREVDREEKLMEIFRTLKTLQRGIRDEIPEPHMSATARHYSVWIYKHAIAWHDDFMRQLGKAESLLEAHPNPRQETIVEPADQA